MTMEQETNGEERIWKYLRPMVKYVDPTHLPSLEGRSVALCSAVVGWAENLKPGDTIEIGDMDDLQIWLTGRVIYSRITALKDTSPAEREMCLMRFVYGHGPNQPITVDEACKLLSDAYGRRFMKNTKVAVTVVDITKARPPVYELRVE